MSKEVRVSEMDLSRVAWRKSRRSGPNGGSCVEVGVAWRKSRRSGPNGGADCVEVGVRPSEALYLVRDSKDPDGPVLSFTPSQWGAFVADVKAAAADDLG